MILIDDIAAAFGTAAEESADFTTAIPGGIWFNRGPVNETGLQYPYSVFGIEKKGDPEFVSDGSYTQSFTIRLAAYAQQGSAKTTTAAQLAMAQAINPDTTSWQPLRNGSILHVLPQGYDGKFAPELWAGSDVFVGGAQWEMLVSGNLAEAP